MRRASAPPTRPNPMLTKVRLFERLPAAANPRGPGPAASATFKSLQAYRLLALPNMWRVPAHYTCHMLL